MRRIKTWRSVNRYLLMMDFITTIEALVVILNNYQNNLRIWNEEKLRIF